MASSPSFTTFSAWEETASAGDTLHRKQWVRGQSQLPTAMPSTLNTSSEDELLQDAAGDAWDDNDLECEDYNDLEDDNNDNGYDNDSDSESRATRAARHRSKAGAAWFSPLFSRTGSAGGGSAASQTSTSCSPASPGFGPGPVARQPLHKMTELLAMTEDEIQQLQKLHSAQAAPTWSSSTTSLFRKQCSVGGESQSTQASSFFQRSPCPKMTELLDMAEHELQQLQHVVGDAAAASADNDNDDKNDHDNNDHNNDNVRVGTAEAGRATTMSGSLESSLPHSDFPSKSFGVAEMTGFLAELEELQPIQQPLQQPMQQRQQASLATRASTNLAVPRGPSPERSVSGVLAELGYL